MVKGSLVTTQAGGSLDTSHTVLVLQVCRMQQCGVMEAFTQISKKAKQHVIGSGHLLEALERVIYETMRVKSKLKWRPRMLEMLGMWNVCKESAGKEWKQPRSEAM
jgi:hypothetical protein